MEYDNDVLIEYDIMKTVSFNGGISVTTSVLVDAVNIFRNRSSKIINFKIKTGARETHKVCWRKDLLKVKKTSNVSVPEIIPLTKLKNICEQLSICKCCFRN